MKVNWSENKQGLVRNIVYFLNKHNQVINSKVILLYYVNKKVCGNRKQSFLFQVMGTAEIKSPFT